MGVCLQVAQPCELVSAPTASAVGVCKRLQHAYLPDVRQTTDAHGTTPTLPNCWTARPGGHRLGAPRLCLFTIGPTNSPFTHLTLPPTDCCRYCCYCCCCCRHRSAELCHTAQLPLQWQCGEHSQAASSHRSGGDCERQCAKALPQAGCAPAGGWRTCGGKVGRTGVLPFHDFGQTPQLI